jgi:hypothetical protein
MSHTHFWGTLRGQLPQSLIPRCFDAIAAVIFSEAACVLIRVALETEDARYHHQIWVCMESLLV